MELEHAPCLSWGCGFLFRGSWEKRSLHSVELPTMRHTDQRRRLLTNTPELDFEVWQLFLHKSLNKGCRRENQLPNILTAMAAFCFSETNLKTYKKLRGNLSVVWVIPLGTLSHCHWGWGWEKLPTQPLGFLRFSLGFFFVSKLVSSSQEITHFSKIVTATGKIRHLEGFCEKSWRSLTKHCGEAGLFLNERGDYRLPFAPITFQNRRCGHLEISIFFKKRRQSLWKKFEIFYSRQVIY